MRFPEVCHALLLSTLWNRIAAERAVLLELRDRGDRCAPSPGRPLVRPIVGRQIAGVCIGVAQANGWDVTLVRILTVVGCLFTSGLVGVAYLAGWIGIPEEPIASRECREHIHRGAAIRRAHRAIILPAYEQDIRFDTGRI